MLLQKGCSACCVYCVKRAIIVPVGLQAYQCGCLRGVLEIVTCSYKGQLTRAISFLIGRATLCRPTNRATDRSCTQPRETD